MMESVNIEKGKNFNDLPPEIQLTIFSFFSQWELMKEIPLVCRKWARLSKDPSLWRRLALVLTSSCDFKDGTCVFKRATQLRFLKFGAFMLGKNEKKILRHLLKNKPPVVELDMMCMSDVTMKQLSVLVKALPCIKRFVAPRFADGFSIRTIIGWSQLTFLNLSNCEVAFWHNYQKLYSHRLRAGINNDYLKDYRELFNHFENLIDVRLPYLGGITSVLIEDLLTSRKKTLRSLSMDLRNIALEDKHYELLSKCGDLKILVIGGADTLSDENLLTLKMLNRLEHLTICEAKHVSPTAWCTFFDSNILSKRLCSLFVSDAFIDDAAIDIFCLSSPCLNGLFLYDCPEITDRGVERIVASCSALKYLKLVNLPKVTTGPLKDITFNLKNLQYLSFGSRQNCIRKDGVIFTTLMEAMPKSIV